MSASVLLIAGIVYSKRSCIQACSCFQRAEQLGRVASIKLSVIFFMAQVISQFSVISSSSGASGRQPQPARAFAKVMGASNIDVLGLVPMACVLPEASSFYHKLLIQTIAPGVVVALLWSYPVVNILRGSPHVDAMRFAAQYSLFGLELLLPSVSTTIAEAFVCRSLMRAGC